MLNKILNLIKNRYYDFKINESDNSKNLNSEIILVLLGGIGDSIIAFDLIQNIKEKFRILTYRQHQCLFRVHFQNLNFIEYNEKNEYYIYNSKIILLKSNEKFKEWIYRNRNNGNTVVFNPLFDNRSLAQRFLFLLSRSRKKQFYATRHMKNYYSQMLNLGNIKTKNVPKIKTKLVKVGIHVSGSVDLRSLRIEFIHDLITELEAEQFYLYGSRDDVDKYSNIKRGDKVINLIGKIELNELSTYLQKMDLVICPDSMIMHYCDYLGVPVIGLMGNSLPELYGLFHQSENIVARNMKCAPCALSRCNKINGYSCIQDIKAMEVVRKIGEIK